VSARAITLTVAAAGAFLIASCDTPTLTAAVPAYDPTAIVPFIYHWQPGHDIAIFVDKTNAPADADLDKAVHDGITAWEAIASLGEVRMHVVSDYHAADVIVHHSQAPHLWTSEDCSAFTIGAGGTTTFCPPLRATPTPIALQLNDGTGGHVYMDVSVNRFALDTASFFPSLVIHELGHVLGIGAHSANPADLMFGRPRRFTPSAADASTLLYVLSRARALCSERGSLLPSKSNTRCPLTLPLRMPLSVTNANGLDAQGLAPKERFAGIWLHQS